MSRINQGSQLTINNKKPPTIIVKNEPNLYVQLDNGVSAAADPESLYLIPTKISTLNRSHESSSDTSRNTSTDSALADSISSHESPSKTMRFRLADSHKAYYQQTPAQFYANQFNILKPHQKLQLQSLLQRLDQQQELTDSDLKELTQLMETIGFAQVTPPMLQPLYEAPALLIDQIDEVTTDDTYATLGGDEPGFMLFNPDTHFGFDTDETPTGYIDVTAEAPSTIKPGRATHHFQTEEAGDGDDFNLYDVATNRSHEPLYGTGPVAQSVEETETEEENEYALATNRSHEPLYGPTAAPKIEENEPDEENEYFLASDRQEIYGFEQPNAIYATYEELPSYLSKRRLPEPAPRQEKVPAAPVRPSLLKKQAQNAIELESQPLILPDDSLPKNQQDSIQAIFDLIKNTPIIQADSAIQMPADDGVAKGQGNIITRHPKRAVFGGFALLLMGTAAFLGDWFGNKSEPSSNHEPSPQEQFCQLAFSVLPSPDANGLITVSDAALTTVWDVVKNTSFVLATGMTMLPSLATFFALLKNSCRPQAASADSSATFPNLTPANFEDFIWANSSTITSSTSTSKTTTKSTKAPSSTSTTKTTTKPTTSSSKLETTTGTRTTTTEEFFEASSTLPEELSTTTTPASTSTGTTEEFFEASSTLPEASSTTSSTTTSTVASTSQTETTATNTSTQASTAEPSTTVSSTSSTVEPSTISSSTTTSASASTTSTTSSTTSSTTEQPTSASTSTSISSSTTTAPETTTSTSSTSTPPTSSSTTSSTSSSSTTTTQLPTTTSLTSTTVGCLFTTCNDARVYTLSGHPGAPEACACAAPVISNCPKQFLYGC